MRSALVCLALVATVALVGGCVTVTSDGRATRLAAAERPMATAGAAGAAVADASEEPSAPPSAPAIADPNSTPSSTLSTAASPTPITTATVGYISLDDSQAFVEAIGVGIRDAAREAGLELITCDAGWTRIGVRACATQLAEAGVQGVISFQPFADLTETVCQTLGDVPVVGVVYEQGSCQVSRLEIDQAQSGRLAGAELGKLAARRWDCEVKAWVELGSGPDDPIGAARMDGFREGYREHCRLPKTRRSLENTQHYITAQTRFASILRQIKGGPIIVAAVSDDAALGALEAARQRGRTRQVWAAGQLAQPDVRRAIACDAHFVASVAHMPERIGARLVPTLVDAVEGREVAPQIGAELRVINAADERETTCDD